MDEKKDYEPVSCDYHDLLEAAATRGGEVEMEFDQQGVVQRERGRIADVFSREGEEFVRLAANSGEVEVRLDRIVALRDIG